MYKFNKLAISAAIVSILSGCSFNTNDDNVVTHRDNNINIWPTIKSEVKLDPEVEKKVKTILASMTLEQKVAQMIQPEIRDITVEDMRKYGFGSYLNGGGAFPNNNKHSTPEDWIKLAENMYQASIDDSLDGSNIPTIWGTDAVHGHNNVIGATLFPHNIGLGATRNPDLIEKIAQITATEVMVTGIDWVFAPTVAVVRDDRWGRTYEGYSEDPEIVRIYAAAIVKGLQGQAGKDFLAENRVISTVKHFLGDGGTEGGDDQGNNVADEQTLFDIHAQGYVGGLTAGAQSVMASFNSWHGEKIHGNKYLLTDVLKNKMGFDGFIVGDWNGHGQIEGCTNDSCPQAINAGLDIFMVPTDAWKPLYENTISQVRTGVIPMSRIDDAVTRILRVKVRAGVFDKSNPANRPYSGRIELIGHESHREVAKQAVRESLVLLKNNNNILPLNPKQNVLITGDAADNIGKQSGGWTITWQGTNNENKDFPGGTSIFDGLEHQIKSAGGQVELSPDGEFSSVPDVAIVVFGEEPYAEGHGDRSSLNYQPSNKSDLALLKKLKSKGIPVISIFISGRPMWVNAELNASDAFVAAWLPGSEGDAIADVLLTDLNGQIQHDFTGKLSYSWPASPMQTTVNRGDEDYAPLLPYGYGLAYGETSFLSNNLNENYESSSETASATNLYNGKVHKPWILSLINGSSSLEVNSSTHSLSGVTYRTIDRFVQEDSIQIYLPGGQNSGLRLNSESHFREDLSGVALQHGKLEFIVRVDKPTNSPVLLNMNCEGFGDAAGSCRASIDISAKLAALPQGEWHKISIPLECFKNKGMNFGGVVIPFELTTIGEFEFSLSNIALNPGDTETVSQSCPTE